MRPPELFISYARDDHAKVRLFAETFIAEGFAVWWDAALHSGETFDEVIEKELRAAKAVVVLWSPRSVASRWVRAEATIADRRKTLAPAIIEPCERPIIFELTHTADLSHWAGDRADSAWRTYVEDLRRLTGTGEVPGQAPASAFRFEATSPRASQSAPQPAPQPVAAALGGDNIAELISAISSLQKAIGGGVQTAPAPAPAAVPAPAAAAPAEDDEATQFFTRGDAAALLSGSVHCLELREGEAVVQRFVVSPAGARIGRSAPADIVLADPKVSRSHCMVEIKDDQLFVADLNSTNGSYVDGTRVAGAAVVPAGATLQIGPFALHHEVRSWAEI